MFKARARGIVRLQKEVIVRRQGGFVRGGIHCLNINCFCPFAELDTNQV